MSPHYCARPLKKMILHLVINHILCVIRDDYQFNFLDEDVSHLESILYYFTSNIVIISIDLKNFIPEFLETTINLNNGKVVQIVKNCERANDN